MKFAFNSISLMAPFSVALGTSFCLLQYVFSEVISFRSGIGSDIGLGVLAGGGLDVALFHRLSLRLFEADYQYARNDYDPGLRTTLNGARLSTGLVWRFGSVEDLGPSASADCSAQPNEIAAGELVRRRGITLTARSRLHRRSGGRVG